VGKACSADGRDKNAYNILVGKPEEKSLLGRQRHRWKDRIRMDFWKKMWEVVD